MCRLLLTYLMLGILSRAAAGEVLIDKRRDGRIVRLFMVRASSKGEVLRAKGVHGASIKENLIAAKLELRDHHGEIKSSAKWFQDLAGCYKVSIEEQRLLLNIPTDWIIKIWGGEEGEQYLAKVGVKNRRIVGRAVYNGDPDGTPAKLVEAIAGDKR